MWLNVETCKLSGCTIWRQSVFLPELELDSKKWPDIRPTGSRTGYLVHPYNTFPSFCSSQSLKSFQRHLKTNLSNVHSNQFSASIHLHLMILALYKLIHLQQNVFPQVSRSQELHMLFMLHFIYFTKYLQVCIIHFIYSYSYISIK